MCENSNTYSTKSLYGGVCSDTKECATGLTFTESYDCYMKKVAGCCYDEAARKARIEERRGANNQ